MPAPSHDTAALMAALEGGPKLIIPIVRDTPPANLKRRPAPEKWSVHEHACHIATVHGCSSAGWIGCSAISIRASIPYEPGDEAPDMLIKMDLEVALERLARERAEIVARIRKLTPAQWERTGEHPEYDRYSVFIMFRHLELHDKLHAYRIEQLAYKKDW